jgi:hypothetical protein
VFGFEACLSAFNFCEILEESPENAATAARQSAVPVDKDARRAGAFPVSMA